MRVDDLQERVEALAALDAAEPPPAEARAVVDALLTALEEGEVRAAVCSEGVWQAVPWVKQGILLAFRVGRVRGYAPPGCPRTPAPERAATGEVEAAGDSEDGVAFRDKDTLPPRLFGERLGVRVVPGGSAVRRGAYLAPGVVCMPPMYVNVGAWVGRESMIDSHALVGSCAQVGARVHVSAAAQIGGVLEPIHASPVVVEDDVVVGGNCGVYEGTVVRKGAVLAAGVILTRSTPLFDLVHERVIRGDATQPLEVPPGAVVVPGSRAVSSAWGGDRGLSLYTPVIVKYRDDKTDLATALERWLR